MKKQEYSKPKRVYIKDETNPAKVWACNIVENPDTKELYFSEVTEEETQSADTTEALKQGFKVITKEEYNQLNK